MALFLQADEPKPSDYEREQARASEPHTSAWVSANAGSGKTHVLVNRVIRLLLAGVPPERILCLTYTRAAAAEMSRRLFDTLSAWIPLDDEALIDRIHQLSGYAKFGGELQCARRLFATALETPGGLKIQTIHAFCERLLQRFPVEAGVVPGFEVLDEHQARELLRCCRDAVLADARPSGGAAGAAVAKVVTFAGDDQLSALLQEMLSKGRVLRGLLSSESARTKAFARLSGLLDLAPGEDEAAIVASAVAAMNAELYREAARTLARCPGKIDPEQGEVIRLALEARSPADAFARLKSAFLKADGEPKADNRVLTASCARNYPDLGEYLLNERDRVAALAMKERALRIRDATQALFELADRVIALYEAEKRRLGRYDYDDLIGRTLSMFNELEHAAWVLYKLDGGLDHILIDEAQDTSLEQWRIVKHLAEEFFAGAGRRDGMTRTVFAVGDRKQSIFSFQGADPDGFDAMRRYFEEKARDASLPFETVRPTISFRSTQTILDAVDAVFSGAAASAGLVSEDEDRVVHKAVRESEAGLIEIWEPEKRDAAEDHSPWQSARPRDAAAHPRLRLARRIAATIRGWVDTGERLANGRAVRAGDVLILLRSRTTFMDALVRALKQVDLPVAGADRLALMDHIAIEDLLALARFTLLPEDDLTLATVLKSPLVARDDGQPIDDGDLFTLAWGRGAGTVWSRLQQAGAPYANALERLRRWRAAAEFMQPYEFFCEVLNRDYGRQGFMSRLGTEAGEPIDAFLELALELPPGRSGSMQALLKGLEDSGAEIKRDMDQGSDEVRVMTVHGAKGLEAPIVILPDTCDAPSGRHDPAVLLAQQGEDGASIPVWRLKNDFETPVVSALKAAHRERARQEYNRLLYVAMTRARDRLYVCGCQASESLKEECWYSVISNALRPLVQELKSPDGRRIWRIEGKGEAKAHSEAALDPPLTPLAPPPWALSPSAQEPRPVRWLVASRIDVEGINSPLLECERVHSPLAGAEANRFRRGGLMHRLLQFLPDLPVASREDAGRAYLQRAAADFAEADREALLAEALAVISSPSLEALFASGSLAEVPLAAVMGREASERFGLTGQIDRLAIADKEVLIADYKTNRPPPPRLEDTDPLYIRQLAAYRAALAELYPGRRVRCCLVWTDGPRLMEIPGDLLDAALPIATASRA